MKKHEEKLRQWQDSKEEVAKLVAERLAQHKVSPCHWPLNLDLLDMLLALYTYWCCVSYKLSFSLWLETFVFLFLFLYFH